DLEVLVVGLAELFLREDRVHRAGLHAGAAVDAGLRFDVELLGGQVLRVVRRRPDAVHRAHVDTGGVVAARLGDHISHRSILTLDTCGTGHRPGFHARSPAPPTPARPTTRN